MRSVQISSEFPAGVTPHPGVVEAGVRVDKSPPELAAEMEARGRATLERLEDAPLSAHPAIAAVRSAYKALGKDPARYRPASEALLRRLAKGRGLYHVNTVVDVNNLISLATGWPICAFDARRLSGSLTFRPAAEGETYEAIGRGEINLSGLPVFSDEIGPCGSPTSDSVRTMIRPETVRVLMIVTAFGSESVAPAVRDLCRALETWAGGHDIEEAEGLRET